MTEPERLILPASVRPSRYELTLTPDMDEFTFRGEESVSIEIVEATSSIALNSAELSIKSCRLTLDDGTVLLPDETNLDQKAETATFRFPSTLPAGPARLDIEFAGELNDKLRGFYRSRYTVADGEERYLASTQFEATDARRAFPCWDEPSHKATFQVILVVPSDLVVVSNMPVAGETDEGPSQKKVRFAETPPMSTYLLAWVVGDLRSIEQRASSGTLIRVWAPAGSEENGRFALDVSARLLSYFNDYFGIPYPLEKLDHITIPDFAAGAMENWGAITYREVALLVDPQHSSAGTRQRVASIVAHEMAHMWFGDLVTMAWWNDLWLNESFASWMGDKAVDHLFPEWQMWTQFLSADTARALELDGLKNSHPIEQEVKNPAEIGELFDAISYSKGGSILRMLEQFLGPEVFRRGIQRYLSDHKYGNARTGDLWDALGAASGQRVAAMMDTWVNQTGYPVLDARIARNQGMVEVTGSQNRFLYERVGGEVSPDEALWHVPFSARSADGPEAASVLMDGREATVQLKSRPDSPAGWIKVNPGQTGFYRVNYAREDWERLAAPIESLELPADDRLGVQNDAYALSRAGLLPVTRFLTLAQAYANETDASVWSDLSSNLGDLDTLLADEPYHDAFEALARGVFQPGGERAGWDARPGEGHLDALMRSTVLSALGHYGDDNTLSEASARFAAFVENQGSVHPDIRTVVLTLAAKRGDRSTYDTMWDLYKRLPLEEEKERLLQALTRFEDQALLQETLERSLTPEVRVHDAVRVIAGVASARSGRDLAWEFLKSNWPEYNRRYGEGGFALMRLVYIAASFSSPQKLADVEQFFGTNPVPAAERTLRQSLEAIGLNIAWLDLNREELAAWFAE